MAGNSAKKGSMIFAIILIFILGNYIIVTIAFKEDPPETRGTYLVSSKDLISYYSEVPPSMDDVSDPLWEYIEYITGAIPLHAPTGSTSLYLSSIYTDTDVYLKITWKDVVKNDDGVYWIYDGKNWTFNSPYEDGLSLCFSNNDPNGYFVEEGCMRSCHLFDTEYLMPENQQRHYTQSASETEDLWFWSAPLTDPYEYAIDAYINNIPSDNRVGYYLDPNEDFGLVKNRPLVDYLTFPNLAYPVFMQNPDIRPSIGPMFIKSGEEVPFDDNYYDPDLGISNINPVTHEPWKKGDTVAGYIVDHRPTPGDISAESYYSNETQEWTVIMRRAMKTDDPANDVQFTDYMKNYLFGISIFGDLMGNSGIPPVENTQTRCVPTKVTDTLSLRFQPIYAAKNLGAGPIFDSFEVGNETACEVILNDPAWSGAQLYTELIYDLNNKEVGKTDPLGSFQIRTAYTTEDLYLRINWSIPFKKDNPRMDVAWQIPETVSMDSKNWQFTIVNDHLSTNSPRGGDLWIVPLGEADGIVQCEDLRASTTSVIADEGSSSDDVVACYGSGNTIVLKRSLITNDTSDIQFEDLTRVYDLSILFYGLGKVDFVQTHLLSIRFEPDLTDLSRPDGVTNLKATDGKDSNAILTWDESTSGEFACYQVYHFPRSIANVNNLRPLTKISDRSVNTIEIDDLSPSEEHHFAVTVLDDNRNEIKVVKDIKCKTTDIKAPSPLNGLKVVAGSDSDAIVSWNATDVPDFGSYRIYVFRAANTNLKTIEPSKVLGVRGETSCRIGGLQKGLQYFFAVSCSDKAGNQDLNIRAKNTVIDDMTAPTKLSGVNAYDIATYGGGSIGIEWNPSDSTDLDHYTVFVSNSTIDDIASVTDEREVIDPNLLLENLRDGSTYYFVVVASDWNGHVSAPSICVSATPTRTGPPEPVESLKASDGKDGRIILTWTPSISSYFDHYCLYMSGSPITDLNSSDVIRIGNFTDIEMSSFELTEMEDGRTYYFAVTVANIHNSEDGSNIVSAQGMSTSTPPPYRNPILDILPYLVILLVIGLVLFAFVTAAKRIKKYGNLKTRRWRK